MQRVLVWLVQAAVLDWAVVVTEWMKESVAQLVQTLEEQTVQSKNQNRTVRRHPLVVHSAVSRSSKQTNEFMR